MKNKIMTSKLLLSSSILLVFSFASCGKCDLTDPEQLNNSDKEFMTKASVSNNAEVSVATMAVTRATNDAVKVFAQHMITEHTTAQTDLKVLANAVGYPIKDSIDPAHAGS